ncbi:PP2C-domain-containing protein [Dichomitus squalens]|uniref:protein-serine/threonine phosphatase n=1 Tax=Dichomitus squalens TaxID=114155 RepID=A0A4Q9Q4Z9_9APHY|nr:PP2C-domain-containing protein [Dichomitus squalens LYAD-421 SS1]EJF63408.1 PP2C-domain-containing protein [Dichomitus squalens LYAD-421 SS1]TBU43573.1 PP2C-domain-containing protein [Dichomitus squalens]TBU62325.1 PP2C-domain-containing protein [Dichomitus squalens]
MLELGHVRRTLRPFSSAAATDKVTEQGANDKYHYGVSEMQGWRITMEDAHTALLNLEEDAPDGNTFFAVYDGHGGSAVARYAGQNLHKRLVQDEAYKKGELKESLKNAFLGTDEDIRSNPEFSRDASGATAVAALLTKDGKIYVANAGDSRSVICVRGEAKQLSYDHKPQNEKEKSRIQAAGGYIEYGRVNGNLALARALGDFDYKKNASIGPEAQIITSDPDIIEHQITSEDEFLIIACDGIWDCLSSQQAVNVVRLLISQGRRLPQICEEICELCLAPDTTTGAGIGCDNMTIMIVAILNGKTQDEWYNWVTDRVKNKYGYQTPETLPQLYSTSRLMSFKVKREAYEQRQRERREREDRERANYIPVNDTTTTSLFGGFANILGGDGSLILHAAPDDDDDDSDDDDIESHGINARSLLSSAGFGRPIQLDMTKSLREQLQELDDMGAFNEHDVDMDDLHDEDGEHEHDRDGHGETEGEGGHASDPESPTYTYNGASSGSSTTLGSRGGETPPPPPTPPNGDATPAQLKHLPPDSEAPSAALKAEGFLDSSESPLKV